MTHPLSFANTALLHQKSANYAISENTVQVAFWYIISKSFNFFESLKTFLIKMVKILIMSAKLATPDFLKLKIQKNKGYDVIIIDYDVTNKTLLCGSNYI